MKRARFISIEDEGTDLILSFALEDDAVGICSLILMRTPIFESLIPEEERGVQVSLEGQTTDEKCNLLIRATLSSKTIELVTQSGIFKVDLSKVDKKELSAVYPFLQKMNFDKKFEVNQA
jgi:hypothetical protein